jgi:hypothetical protein
MMRQTVSTLLTTVVSNSALIGAQKWFKSAHLELSFSETTSRPDVHATPHPSDCFYHGFAFLPCTTAGYPYLKTAISGT